ncbi:MAG: hypothetical protein DRO00_01010 [Thermoproteota archaeon]|nr:MAG: hypothetical protein DRO00_01010 [Candidatus Korarchaeota archaeon]
MHPLITPEKVVIYDKEHWSFLKRLRKRAIVILGLLLQDGIKGILYGSIARGDVRKGSDVDIVVLRPTLPSLIEDLLSEKLGDPLYKEIVQSTPIGAIKGYFHYEENLTISFPLSPLKEREELFYKFGGSIDLHKLKKDVRVPGVNKKLVLILPFEKGHYEVSVVGKESVVADILGIPKEVIDERVRVLTKRREKGKTGVYLKYRLQPGETFESALRKIMLRRKGTRGRLAGLI